MAKLKCYYAHMMISYGSTIEAEDVAMLEGLGFEVINPNHPRTAIACKSFVAMYGNSRVMEFFADIVADCDLLAFRSLPSGEILSGISAEIQEAIKCDIPVIELPCSLNKRMQEYPETKQYLTELGFYKIKI